MTNRNALTVVSLSLSLIYACEPVILSPHSNMYIQPIGLQNKKDQMFLSLKLV